jgi:hypothetical protein
MNNSTETINSNEFQSSLFANNSLIFDQSSSKKLISYQKSKEYSKLASKAPIVFNAASG